ncbi:MAG: FtsX-like permease family protein, partial [Ruminococcus sp.]|nr:FtsX-like permease family protein [Ruminococcus sp.]
LRAYNTEWGIKMITYNPFIFSIVCTLIGSLIAYIIPCIRLKKLLLPKTDNHSILKLKGKKSNFNAVIKSILYQPSITGLQIISLVLVLVVSSSAYMFFSTENKSSKQNPQILVQGDSFNTNIGLDMRTYNIDCVLQSTNENVAGIMQTDTTGITQQAMDNIEKSSLFENVLGFKDIDSVFLYYPHETSVTQNVQNIDDLFAPNEKQWYGIQDYDVYTFNNCMIVSDSIISQLSEYSDINIEKLNNGGIIELDLDGGSKYQVGDILPIVTAYGNYNINSTDTYYYDLQEVNFSNSEIITKISINNLPYDEIPLLYSIFSSNSKYIMLYSMQGAKSIGLVNNNINSVYLMYAQDTTDSNALKFLNSVLSADMEVSKTTITDCQSSYNKSMIKEYLIVFTVFGLFFIISMIGYVQTIRLQIYKKSYQFSILKALGINKKKLQTSIVLQILTTPIISSIIGFIAIQGIKKFLEYKYNYWEVSYAQHGEYTIDKQVEYLLQQAKYFTQYEMYKVPTTKIFIILIFIIFIFTLICTYKISKNVVNANLAEDLRKQEH